MTSEPERRWSIEGYGLRLGTLLRVLVQRTTQTPSPDLPPRSYGALPLGADPATSEVLVPVVGDEAIWLGLEPLDETAAVAFQVEVWIDQASAGERRDAVTGGPWLDELTSEPQNYVVCPPQRAIDGITTTSGRARQFARVATTPGAATVDRLRLIAIPGSGPTVATPREPALRLRGLGDRLPGAPAGREGGQPADPDSPVGQVVARDPFGRHHWRLDASVTATLRLVSPEVFAATTGRPAPAALDPRAAYDGRRLP